MLDRFLTEPKLQSMQNKVLEFEFSLSLSLPLSLSLNWMLKATTLYSTCNKCSSSVCVVKKISYNLMHVTTRYSAGLLAQATRCRGHNSDWQPAYLLHRRLWRSHWTWCSRLSHLLDFHSTKTKKQSLISDLGISLFQKYRALIIEGFVLFH